MSKASEEALGKLHAALAEVLMDSLRDPEGLANSAILSVARQFLKDNKIETGNAAANPVLQGLAGLPVFDDPDVIPIRKASQA